MRFVRYRHNDQAWTGLREDEQVWPIGTTALEDYLRQGLPLSSLRDQAQREQPPLAYHSLELLSPLQRPGKILCVGLNYRDHVAESRYEQPDAPVVFLRAASSLAGHGAPVVQPACSDSLDYEGELAVVLGAGGRNLDAAAALASIAGYSVFNDITVREFQFNSTQWTLGKNFDGTGIMRPDLVSAEALPPGAKGLQLKTWLNEQCMQSASTSDMIHDPVALIQYFSRYLQLEAGDVIVTGTPSGVGWVKKPRLTMQPGDICRVSIESIGSIENRIVQE